MTKPKLTEEELVKYGTIDLTTLPKSIFDDIKNRLPDGYVFETRVFTAGVSREMYPCGLFIKNKPKENV